MSLWKFGIYLAIVGVASSETTSFEVNNKRIKSIDFMDVFSNSGKDFFSKYKLEELRNIDPKNEVNVNEYIDKFLETLNNYIVAAGVDPTQIPDCREEFERKVVFITYKGDIALTKGWLRGLSTLKRAGDVTLSFDGKKMSLHMPLTFMKLTFDYQYEAKFMGIGPSGGLDGAITDTKFTIDVDVDLTSLKAELRSLTVENSGDISLKFSGNILTDWFVNIFSSVLMPVFKQLLGGLVSDFFHKGATDIIQIYNSLICSILGSC